MAKLNILLGFLWAAGCGSLSMAQDSNVTVHSQTTAQSPGASTTHTVPINIASSVTTLVATTMTTTANILTPTTKAGTGFTTPLSSSSSTSSSLSISSSNAIVTTVENPKSSTNGTTEKATDKPTTEKARETATQLPGAATVQPSRSPTTSSTVSPATSETSQPNSTLTTTMPASATSNSSVFSQQTSVPQAHDGKATTSVNVTASALPSTSSSTASSVTSSPSFSLSSSNSTPYIATSIKTTESTTTSVPTTSVDLFPTTTFTKTTKSTVISQVQIQVTCEKIIFNDSQIKMNMKVPQNCNSETMQGLFEMQGKKNFMEQLCKAVKPGFQPSVDNCKVVFGYNGQLNDQLAIVEAMVETRLNPQDLYAKLKDEKTKEGLPLFSYASKEAIVDEDWLSLPLIITIVCMAVSLLIIAAIYGCWHQKQSHKREQRLTEELQTMENGYHDNPTLEVMETAPEMQEKKGGLNGELGDSWIVPLDNLTREDLEEEEDTHL